MQSITEDKMFRTLLNRINLDRAALRQHIMFIAYQWSKVILTVKILRKQNNIFRL